ncbi:MAG: FAD-binding protein [Actinomycetia bacterium]|nr:FAD-binding protein [Actinomycetes bacterium]MCP4087163.1 FAD-binding protein [Actinomycetes bacterium]
MTEPLDLLVIGSGVAGLSAAVRAVEVHGMAVGVVTKGELDQTTTRWAQGGVAAVLGGDPDSTDLHLADTLAAGAGLCDVDAVRVLVDEGPGRVSELITLGAMFDRGSDGDYLLAREGGHSMPRILHAGGAATGAEIERALVAAVQRTAAVIHEHAFASDLLVEAGRCVGAQVRLADRSRLDLRARNVLCAAGGAGQLFAVTTNPVEATGDGVAMALRAGAAVADLEFFQFHPTALHHPLMPRPLLSEALRGHGALLRDRNGERFIDELLPRDEVSRAMTARMIEQDVDHLWLDATVLEHFLERFPTIAASLAELDLDPGVDYLPIAPAAHYLCGGVITDLDGASSVPGFWAAGEVACTGVHGANRLASNSLLEGMVFAPRAVEAIAVRSEGPSATGAMRGVVGSAPNVSPGVDVRQLVIDPMELPSGPGTTDPAAGRAALQAAMTRGAGVLRSAESLAATAGVVGELAARCNPDGDRPEAELANLLVVGRSLLAAAGERTGSQGAHTRSDSPPDTVSGSPFRIAVRIGQA